MRLDVKASALTAALVSFLVSLAMVLYSVLTGKGRKYFEILAPFHPGYSHSIHGAFVTAGWMFIYGYIIGGMFARIYNLLSGK